MSARQLDEAALQHVVGQAVTDMGAALNGVLMMIGERARVVEVDGRRGAAELGRARPAQRSAGALRARVARGAGGERSTSSTTPRRRPSSSTPEHALALADEDSPFYVLGGYHLISSAYKDRVKIGQRLRAGEGIGWHEHDPELFLGAERFFRPGYRAHLVPEWIPALDGVEAKLRAGAKVADIGCGHGVSTILMAQAFPRAAVHGFDFHQASIERARELAEAKAPGRTRSSTSPRPRSSPATGYDLVCFFDCLHDMGDPVGVLRHVRDALAPDGAVMLVEPLAADSLAGQPQPGRPDLLRRLDAGLHAELARPGGGARARRPGGRAASDAR